MDKQPLWNTVFRVLAWAAALGVLADLLLREGPWGLNAALWTAAFAFAVWVLSRDSDTLMPKNRRCCIPLIAIFGVLLAWRDAPMLKLLNIAVIFLLCATLVLRPDVKSLLRTGFMHYAVALIDGALGIVAGLPSMASTDVPRQVRGIRNDMDDSQSMLLRRHAWSVSIGMLISFPLLLIFGALFTSADTAFRAWVSEIFHLNWEVLIEHAFTIGITSWVTAGYLYAAFLKRQLASSPESAFQGVRLDALAILIPLGSLIALFGAFIAMQIPYFFGGNAVVQTESGPSYATYAREGFFQLTAVAALALGVLLVADWLGRDASPQGRRALHSFTAILVALVFVVMASALDRMALYTSAYGLTTLRFYTTAFMLWLAGTLAWFLLAVLKGKRERFLFPALALACVFVIAFNFINPERIIVEVNTSRTDSVEALDIEYLLRLGNDAAPALVALTDRLPEREREHLRSALVQRIDFDPEDNRAQYSQRLDIGGWRAWSWSRERAREAIEDMRS